jgi:hypothetical protein
MLPLWERWRQVAPLTDKLKKSLLPENAKSFREALVSTSLSEIASQTLTIAGAGVPFAGLMVDKGMGALNRTRTHVANRKAAREDTVLPQSQTEGDLVSRIADNLTRLAIPGLPVIVVLEDAQDADADTCRLIETLATSPAQVLIIATTWPEGLAPSTNFAKVAEPLGAASRALLIELDAPDDHALVELLTERLPNTDPRKLQALAQLHPTPLALEFILTLDKVSRHITDGRLDLDLDEINQLPTQIAALYQSRWELLPQSVRQALLVAAAVDDALAAEYDDPLYSGFLPAAIAAMPLDGMISIEQSDLDRARDEFRWTTALTVNVDSFREPALRQVAAEAAHQHFLRSETAPIHTSLRSLLLDLAPPDQLAQVVIARQVVIISWLLDIADQALADALHVWSTRLGQSGRSSTAVKVANRCRQITGMSPRDADLIDAQYVRTLITSGELEQATQLQDRIVAYRTANYPPHDRKIFQARRLQAYLLSRTDHTKDALTILDDLLPAATQGLGKTSPTTLRITFDKAEMLTSLGEYDQATELVTELFHCCRRLDQPKLFDEVLGLHAKITAHLDPRAGLVLLYTRMNALRMRGEPPTSSWYETTWLDYLGVLARLGDPDVIDEATLVLTQRIQAPPLEPTANAALASCILETLATQWPPSAEPPVAHPGYQALTELLVTALTTDPE